MLGAIIGDIIGSPYEWHNIKTKDFELFRRRCRFTDDSVMTIAVGEALMEAKRREVLDDEEAVKKLLVASMKKWGLKYPDAGYGRAFFGWLISEDSAPYN
ncbi:MAG: ADP-ribosylglycohydrolase family protein, partial [Clostridiales bacterium]|nr:ADP-ribosylglycohydrolase family protein [Clostridiales bacterium]